MMFVFTILLMLAFGAVLYLMVRALPRLAEDTEEKESFLDRWAKSRMPERIDAAFNGFLLKFLRRMKVFALMFDNAVSVGLRKVSAEDKTKKPPVGIKDLTEAAGDAVRKDGDLPKE